jgi:serine/threonine-protein kinase
MRSVIIAGLFCIAVTTLVVTQALAQAQAWTTYHNPRFGATADVPAGWQPGRPPDNGDGLVFTSPDGAAHLTISGSLNVWDMIEEAMEIYEIGNAGETVTYTHRESKAVTVSGTKGDLIFYAKHILSCRDQVWNSIYLEYPVARKKEFDPLVVHIAHSLRPGVSEQVEECNK